MAREAPRLDLSPYEIIDLRRLANAPSTPQALAFRARIILRCDSARQRGVPRSDQIAAELGCAPDTVAKWRRRFQRHRCAGLCDLPRSGRPAAFSPEGQTQSPGLGHHPAGGCGCTHLALVAGRLGLSHPQG